jgi:hypothetical protein
VQFDIGMVKPIFIFSLKRFYFITHSISFPLLVPHLSFLNIPFPHHTSISLLSVDVWLGVLRNKSVVWISSTGKFVTALKVAFSSPLVGVSTEPSLYVVSSDMLQFKPLLMALGVKDR